MLLQIKKQEQIFVSDHTLFYFIVLSGPPPHGKKHLVSPVEYEQGLKQQSEMGDKGQSMGGGT